ncbi:hypothetical protein CF165_49020 [Amycolatopsis vastitatis]|uniref:Uncharacterized protein n=1 Tax=Amycolatopsis vastitatis TaxID=1905142 RepID=A0A229SKA9_9PSEU|nr:hypothetical protein CF165_49020 [Amycolatopsis vastitatis]
MVMGATAVVFVERLHGRYRTSVLQNEVGDAGCEEELTEDVVGELRLTVRGSLNQCRGHVGQFWAGRRFERQPHV